MREMGLCWNHLGLLQVIAKAPYHIVPILVVSWSYEKEREGKRVTAAGKMQSDPRDLIDPFHGQLNTGHHFPSAIWLVS